MKAPASNPNSAQTRNVRRPFTAIAAIVAVSMLAAPSALAASNDYFGTNNPAGDGYTDASGGDYWGTSTTETGGSAWANSDIMVFGINPGDFAAVNGFSAGPYAYTIALNNGSDIDGFVVGATNIAITLGGSSNDHFDTSPITISVTNDSTLIWDNTRDGGFNFNKETVTLTGPGTNIFLTDFGGNDTAVLSQGAETGGAANNVTVILDEASYGSYALSGGYDLYSGSLIFETAAACDSAFNSFSSGTHFQIGWGSPGPNPILDNTSGSDQTLALGSGVYSLAGDFTFVGSSSLSLGTPGVQLTGNPRQITVENNMLSIFGVISNAPSTSGDGLNKLGAGTLQLGGANTYDGPTFVLDGTLQLTNSGSIAASSGLVVSSAAFDVSGLTGGETMVSSLSLSNSPTLVVSEPSGSVTNIIATTLNVDGTPVTVNVNALPPIMGYPAVFPIVESATVNGTLNFILGSLPPSSGNPYQGYVTNISPGGLAELVLTNGPAPVFAVTWTGKNNGIATGTWDVQNTADWLYSGSPILFNQGDEVTFNDLSNGGSNIVNMVQEVQPSTLFVSNNVTAYTFTGSYLGNNSPGTLTLNKEGTGTLTLQENGDNFSGGINAAGGTVIVDNNSSGISGGATIATNATVQLGNNDTGDQLPQGNITVNGSLVFNCADNPTTVSSPLLGSGTVMQISTNMIVLNDSGGSSGNWSTVIKNGTLQIVDSSALGSLPGGTVTITNGGTLDLGGDNNENDANFGAKQFIISGAGVNGGGAIINSSPYEQEDAFGNIALTNNATVGGPSRWDVRNGTPQLNLEGFTLTVTNISQLSLVDALVTPGDIIVQNGADLSLQEGCSVANAGTITIESGASLSLYASTLGSVRRNIVLNGGCLTNISGDNETAYLDSPILMQQSSSAGNFNIGTTTFYDGAISDGGDSLSLSFDGIGTNLLSGTNTYTGPTIVNGVSLGLSGQGSISASSQIIVTNYGIFDLSQSSIPFSGTNTLVLGDDVNGQGTLNLGSTVITNFNSLSLVSPILNMAVANAGSPCITVNTLYLGDGSQSGTINITALPLVISTSQFPLIKYTNVTGTYSLNLGGLPSGYDGTLVNDTANHSIDLQITQQPQVAGIWDGGGAPANNYWSDPANWQNSIPLTGTDRLIFTGDAGLNNTNDTSSETATSLAFNTGAGAFVLNGNGVVLAGGVTNLSTAVETVNLPLSFSSADAFSGTAGPLIIGGGVTNASIASVNDLTLAGTGVLTNLLYSLNATSTNVLALNSASANWTILDNPSSIPMTIPWTLQISNGTVNFGNAGSAPNLTSLTIHNVPADNQLGIITGATGTLNITNGVLTLNTLNTGQALNSTGIVNVAGGSIYIGPIGSVASDYFQGANGANMGENSIVNISGGSMNLGMRTNLYEGTFFVASRGNGTLTVSGSGALNCSILDLSRNADGNTFGSIGVVNLNGGSIITTRVGTATADSQTGPPTDGINPSATFNFNGGILRAATNSTTFYQGSTASPAIPIASIVQAGGAVIDSSNFAITVLEPLQHYSTLGATQDGGLVKLGSGTLTLTAASTYTGPTIVSNGTLAVDGSLADTSGSTVEANGTLAGTGSLGGNVTVTAGGTVAPGNIGTNGTLTVAGTVTLAGNAELDLNAAALTNSVLISASSIAYGGTLSVANLSGPLAAGDSFTLFQAPSLAGAFIATNLPALNQGLEWNWNPANGTLSVVQGGTIPPTVSPAIKGFSIAGANITISGTNAQAGATYYLLTSTNLLLPLSQWTAISTNVATGANDFSFIETNAVTPNTPKQFYILSGSNN